MIRVRVAAERNTKSATGGKKAMVDEKLLEILACPACKGGIEYDKENEKLICQKCGRRYPVRDGIPVMLIDEAELPEEKTRKAQE